VSTEKNLKNAQEAALQAARETFCWEQQKSRLLGSIRCSLRK
jgi:hypothetical protein